MSNMHIQKGEEEPTKEVYVSLHQKHSELAEENLSTAIEFLSRLTGFTVEKRFGTVFTAYYAPKMFFKIPKKKNPIVPNDFCYRTKK
jgi:hypothetical protein